MNYKFPIIENIEQFEPIIAKNPAAYYKVDKGDYVVFNYSNLNPNNFPPVETPEDAYIREARGIAFLKSTGALISRPFHKFFNLGEREETEIDIMSFQEARMYEKMDGSMIHPLNLPGGFRLATRGGITDVSMQPETFVAANLDYQRFINEMLHNGLTPIFEWVSPDNKIVINYNEPRLVLLDVRNRVTGVYAGCEGWEDWAGIPTVKRWNDITLEEVRKWEDAEGVVVRLVNGHRVKVKAETYVRLHRYIDIFRSDRHFVAAYLSEAWDDIYSNATPEVKIKLRTASERFTSTISEKAQAIVTDILDGGWDHSGYQPVTKETRRNYADWVLGNSDRKHDSSIYFKIADVIQLGPGVDIEFQEVAKFWIQSAIRNKTKSEKDWTTNNPVASVSLLGIQN